MPVESDRETVALRTAVRELVALSAMPAAWVGREPRAIAGGLADVLAGSLNLEFAFVRLCDPGGGAAIDATRGQAWTAFPDWLQRRLGGGRFSYKEVVADVGGTVPCRGVVVPIGVHAEGGLVAAASSRAEFPSEIDQLLLSVAANHAAAAFQNARLRDELASKVAELGRAGNELEAKVTERTAELKQRDDERERLLRSERAALADAVVAQERFRDLVNSVDGIVWEADASTFAFSFVSKQTERILGYPAEQWLSESTFWSDHLHPDDREWAVDYRVSAATAQRDYDFEYRMIAADRRVVWLRDLVTVVAPADGAARLRGVMVDITERKQAEGERHAHLKFFESLDRINRAIQSTNDLEQMISAVLDEALAIFECDRAWLGYPCDPEAPSLRISTKHTRPAFRRVVAPDDEVPIDPELVALIEAVRAASGPLQFGAGLEHPLPAVVASRFGVQSQMSMAIYPKGDRVYLFGLHQCSYARVWTRQEEQLLQEIGRRLGDALTSLLMFRNLRQSESRLEAAQRIAHVGHWERDVATNRGTWSDETYRIFGLAPQDGVVDFDRFLALIHPDDRERVARAAADGGGARYDVEFRVVRPDGEMRIVHSQGRVARDASGGPNRVFGIIQDITEQRQAEAAREALRQAQADLAHISRVTTMGELTASLAHEIKQPITAAVTDARTCLRWLGRDVPDLEEAREAASRVVQDVTRAADIISSISVLFKKGAPEREPLDVNELIREMIVLLRSEATRFSIAIRAELAPDLPRVLADRVQLQQVFMNLMLNSIDAMKTTIGGNELTITSAADHDQLVISVSDTGVGLPPDQRDQIFRAFVTNKDSGTGMGLPISRSIVESHGGRLWASDNAGRGATFQFALPVTLAAQP